MQLYRFLFVTALAISISAVAVSTDLISTASAADPSRNTLKVKRLRGGEQGVGKLVANIVTRDLLGNPVRLRQLANENRAVVVAMTSTSCPVSEKYLPTLQRLADRYADQKVEFVLVNSVPSDSMPSMLRAQKGLGTTVSYVADPAGAIASAIGANSTTDALLIDHDGTIAYHGAVDDQHRFDFSYPAAQHKFLVDAIEALLVNKSPNIEATTAPGTALEKKPQTGKTTGVTYHNRISRLMNRHCVKCHRDGGVGPFALDSFASVSSHAPMIGEVIRRGTMPPWFAAGEQDGSSSPWANDASMTPAEQDELLAWANGLQTEGDVNDAPEPLSFSGQWQIGEPDVVYEFPRAIPVRATGVMPYKYVEIDTKLLQNQWVEAVEVVPSDPSVVHHVLVYAVGPGEQVRNQVNYWAGYVPGNGARTFPPAHARRLQAGSKLVFQMHYTPNGTPTSDRTKIGIRFADDPPEFEVLTGSVINRRFSIPAGAKNVRVEAELRIPMDTAILGFMPHHHLRGVAGRFELVGPNQNNVTLLDVPNYDFNWQLFYQYAKPTLFRRGSTIRYTAWYDNSDDNPANPNPNVNVRWGPQTVDEMHVGYIEFALPTGIN